MFDLRKLVVVHINNILFDVKIDTLTDCSRINELELKQRREDLYQRLTEGYLLELSFFQPEGN